MAELTRIGIFYDGSFFARVSEYYRYHHERGTWISIAGLHEFVRDEVAKREQTDARYCKIVEAHYFRGRFPAEEAAERKGALLRERRFEDVLIRAGVTPHFLIMRSGENRGAEASTPPAREKGIDVWLALEAYELALRQHLNVVVLVTGDGDFLQLVRKLSTNGTRIMVTAWDLQPSANVSGTRTAQVLLHAAPYPVMSPMEAATICFFTGVGFKVATSRIYGLVIRYILSCRKTHETGARLQRRYRVPANSFGRSGRKHIQLVSHRTIRFPVVICECARCHRHRALASTSA